MNPLDQRLARIRGAVPAKKHSARTIAALTSNPGCHRRAVMDAAGVDKATLAAFVGFPAPFGQSQFAMTRGNAFEAMVKADGCAWILTLLREMLPLPIPEVSYDNLEDVGGNESSEFRHVRTQHLLGRSASNREDAGTLFDHPMLALDVAGHRVYLEPDLIAFQLEQQFHVVEIKSFAIIDGQADPGKAAAAAMQSAVYVHALRELLGRPDQVADRVILVCPKDFSNQPTAVFVDVRKQLSVLRRQLSRLASVATLVDELPPDLTVSVGSDPVTVATDLSKIVSRYAPECLNTCELGRFCRHEAAGRTDAMGRSVRDDLGGVEYALTALQLARAGVAPSPEQMEAAELLQLAWRLRLDCLGHAA